MQTKDKNIKTICPKNVDVPILPVPAKVVADLTGTSESYVKKLRNGFRNDASEKAQVVKYCEELILGGQRVLLEAVKASIDKLKTA